VEATVAGNLRRHVPDFVLIEGPTRTHHHRCPSSCHPLPEPRRSRRRARHRHRHLNPASEASKPPARNPLLARDSPRSRHRLTALGRQFMKQVQGGRPRGKPRNSPRNLTLPNAATPAIAMFRRHSSPSR
jgi:hypothetical protein